MHGSPKALLQACAAVLFATALHAGNELNDALKHKPDRNHGGKLYATFCASCHRSDGSGAGMDGVPNIAGQHSQVVLKQIVDFRDTERMDLRMEAATTKHRLRTAQDLADVAAYVAAMPTQGTTDLGTSRHLSAGKLAYDRACAHCHGATGKGNARLRYPRLAGQHYTYLLKQIDTMVGGSRFNVSWDHAQMLTSLTDEEMMGVADYLSRLEN